MESQNKLFEEFKAAAAADEQTTFPAQDKLWQSIEQQLDKQETKSIKLFSFNNIKYMAAAVVLIAGIAVGWNTLFNGKNNESIVATGSTVAPATNKEGQQIVAPLADAPLQSEKSKILKLLSTSPAAVTHKEHADVASGIAEPENSPAEQAFTLNNFTQGPESLKERFIGNTAPELAKGLEVVEVLAVPEAIPTENDFPEERFRKVYGVVVDKAGVALANAKVSFSGTDKLVTSDAQGKFALDVPDTAEFIIVRSYGNETKYVKVAERLDYKIEISPDKSNVAVLNDIARYNRSGMQNLHSSPLNTNSMRQELASKQKRQTVLSQAPSVDPLIIVDGAPYSGKFSDINTKHIKDVKILPEATARALYGERAKNGVIVITLKKGKSVSAR